MTPSETLIVEPDDSVGSNIMSLLSSQGLLIRSDCGGKGICGKCRVLVEPATNLSGLTDAESELLSKDDLSAGIRLACQASPTGRVQVTVPEDSIETGEVIGKIHIPRTFEVDPMVRRHIVEPAPNAAYNQRDLVGILRSQISDLDGETPSDPAVLAELAFNWSETEPLTLVKHITKGVTAVLPGPRPRSLGFAVDIGTTTVAAYLCDLESGRIVAASGSANPQRRHGEDVITRITFATQTDCGLRRLQELITSEINSRLNACLRKCDAEASDVDEVVIVGNTTMQHLFCGFSPGTLGVAPYRPVTCAASDWRASDLGLNLNPLTNVHVFPVISGFVGGDTVAAILGDRPDLRDQVSLLVDIGTNGEIVLAKGDELWATSCATGPALEGAHISCGMRAVRGAIHTIRVKALDYSVSYDFFGTEEGSQPRGVCGSGIIDAVAEMRRAGIILPNGRINEATPGVAVDSRGIGRGFILVPEQSSATGSPIQLTLNDVRQIQVAKAALAVGIRLLMSSAGVDRADRLVLTGAFGARFDWKNAAAIGMLPPCAIAPRIESLDNAAGVGAVAALLDAKLRQDAARFTETVRVVELAEHPDFPMEFPMSMDFPPLP